MLRSEKPPTRAGLASTLHATGLRDTACSFTDVANSVMPHVTSAVNAVAATSLGTVSSPRHHLPRLEEVSLASGWPPTVSPPSVRLGARSNYVSRLHSTTTPP